MSIICISYTGDCNLCKSIIAESLCTWSEETSKECFKAIHQGKAFLFLPDSHSAYYDSFVSAFGRSLPPLTGSFKNFLYLVQFLAETAGGEGGGGWWAHPPALATLGKMALGKSVRFLGIGRSD